MDIYEKQLVKSALDLIAEAHETFARRLCTRRTRLVANAKLVDAMAELENLHGEIARDLQPCGHEMCFAFVTVDQVTNRRLFGNDFTVYQCRVCRKPWSSKEVE